MQNQNIPSVLTISPMESHHWPRVKEIYESGIATGISTFETQAPTWEQWDLSHLPFARLVAQLNQEVVGWAALSPVSSRCVHGGVAEVSVYVDPKNHSNGIGYQLLKDLIQTSEDNGIWTLQAGIFPNNLTSINLHEKLGFRRIGYREKIGKMGSLWMDNIILEKRSTNVGID